MRRPAPLSAQATVKRSLLTSVWGRDDDLDFRTIDVRIRRLRGAINFLGTLPDVIRTVRSAGYSLGDELA
jgi:two-component system phosphate regulon response regulator PhoB